MHEQKTDLPEIPWIAPRLTNADIAHHLLSLAQLLAAKKENIYKIKAYRQAARTIANTAESVEEEVRKGEDLRKYPGIGEAIRQTIHEIVFTGGLKRIDALRAAAGPEISSINDYPLLDPRRVLRIYKKLGISSIDELKDSLRRGEIAEKLGPRMDQHVRRALSEDKDVLWYDAEKTVARLRDYLISRCKVSQAIPVGEFRRKVGVVSEIAFLVETADLAPVVQRLRRYAGGTDLVRESENQALLRLPSGLGLTLVRGAANQWGIAMIESTGSQRHLEKIESQKNDGLSQLRLSGAAYPTENDVYRALSLAFVPPELREGNDEVLLAAQNRIPDLVSTSDIRGELHAHTVSSDGVNTLEEMVLAAREKGFSYIGISEHSQSLKIANGLSEEDLWKQIHYIDGLNERGGIRILKGTEVDILQDGSLDYPDEVLKELDYRICSIHSRFGLGRTEQTERILRAMDNRYFNILGHATGRLLLKRPGYEIDIDRLIAHARETGCHFELNSSPDRLDVSASYARLIAAAGVGIAVTTDAHSIHDFNYLRYGIDQARRAGLEKENVLNHLDWPDLLRALQR